MGDGVNDVTNGADLIYGQPAALCPRLGGDLQQCKHGVQVFALLDFRGDELLKRHAWQIPAQAVGDSDVT